MRKYLDSFGTIFWFLMDVCWMFGFLNPAYVFMFLTLSMFLIFPDWKNKTYNKIRLEDFGVYLSTNGWVLMNSTWMLQDSITSKEVIGFLFLIKIISVSIAVTGFIIIASTNIESFKNIRKIKTISIEHINVEYTIPT